MINQTHLKKYSTNAFFHTLNEKRRGFSSPIYTSKYKLFPSPFSYLITERGNK
jgi:hypothetical protein